MFNRKRIAELERELENVIESHATLTRKFETISERISLLENPDGWFEYDRSRNVVFRFKLDNSICSEVVYDNYYDSDFKGTRNYVHIGTKCFEFAKVKNGYIIRNRLPIFFMGDVKRKINGAEHIYTYQFININSRSGERIMYLNPPIDENGSCRIDKMFE